MTSSAEHMENVQIAISDTNEFLQDLPSFFHIGTDSKLHHDSRKVNVFTWKKNLFADSYSKELKVESPEELALVKQRLLTLPIYMHVHLEKHRRSGNRRIITHADYVLMINTKHPDIAAQFQEKLEEAQSEYALNHRFALEIDLGPVLRGWFASRIEDNWGNYIAKYSSFCITNFTQRSKLCVNPVAWVLLFPVCLVVAPLHCAYRAIISNDFTLTLTSTVQYVRGISPLERAQLRSLVQAAYIQGLSQAARNPRNDQMRYEQAYNQMPIAPPAKDTEQPPPSYDTLDIQENEHNGRDVPMLNNIA